MKTIVLFWMSCFTALSLHAKTVTFTIQWQFIHVVEGYDHENKLQVYIDGTLAGESAEIKESTQGAFTCSVSKGKHEVHIVSLTHYGEKWEEHTIANDYSIDAVVDESHEFSKNAGISIIWDIDGTQSGITWSDSKKAKTSSGNIDISWTFHGIIAGYDHVCRTKVYIDNKLVATSKEVLESEGGSVRAKIKPGKHDIRIISECRYEGKWEEHTIANDYSIDAQIRENRNFGQQNKAIIVFDIEAENTTVEWK